MYDKSHGGDDALTGGDALLGGPDVENKLYGDADEMHGNTHGGDDTLTGGDNLSVGFLLTAARIDSIRVTNTIYGDAGSMDGNARGGNDTLIGGDSTKNLTYVAAALVCTTPSMATPAPCTTTPAAAMTR